MQTYKMFPQTFTCDYDYIVENQSMHNSNSILYNFKTVETSIKIK
jgi:hypothetical protein